MEEICCFFSSEFRDFGELSRAVRSSEFDFRGFPPTQLLEMSLSPILVILFMAHLAGKMGKREYLNDLDTRGLMNGLNGYFEMTVEIPRIRFGKKQTLARAIFVRSLLFLKCPRLL
jgi:hypothetical protein